MANQFLTQNNFSHGELDPRMYPSRNLDIYYKCAKYIRNGVVRPQGGVKRRQGLQMFANLSLDSPFEVGNGQIVPYLSLNNEYLLYFYNVTGPSVDLAIFQVGTSSLTLITTLMSVWTNAFTQIKYAQAGTTLVVTAGNSAYNAPGIHLPPLVFTIDPTNTPSINPLNFKIYPQADFLNNYSTATFTLSSVDVGLNVTLTCNQAVFTSNHVNGSFVSLGQISGNSTPNQVGMFQITAFTDSMHVIGNIVAQFDASLASGGIIGANCDLFEPAFSDARGWPNAVGFYESRLVFGGNFSLPQTLWFSQTGDYSNFDVGQGDDDQGFDYLLAGKVPLQIQRIVSDKALMVFCDYAEFVSEQTYTQALTPSNKSIRQQSTWGSLDVQPAVLDSTVFFAKRGGQAIMASNFDIQNSAWHPTPISLISAHLINNPVSLSVSSGDGEEDADYLVFNNIDGTFVSLQFLKSEDISAFTLNATGPWVTNPANMTPPLNADAMLETINIGNDIYTLCYRNHAYDNGVYTLEKLTFDVVTDSALLLTGVYSGTISSPFLGQSIGVSLRLIIDDIIYPNVTPVIDPDHAGNGMITLPVASADYVEAGINVSVLLTPLFVTVPGSNLQYIPQKIARAWIDIYQSTGIYINNTEMSMVKFTNMGPDPNNPVQLKTGTLEYLPTGWRPNVDFNILQVDPLPFLVLAFGVEVTTGS